jgi:hypothetical protein
VAPSLTFHSLNLLLCMQPNFSGSKSYKKLKRKSVHLEYSCKSYKASHTPIFTTDNTGINYVSDFLIENNMTVQSYYEKLPRSDKMFKKILCEHEHTI